MAGVVKDDYRLHKYCNTGKIPKIEDYFKLDFKSTDLTTLHDRLNSRRGLFGYTPLHEAVSGNRPQVIEYLKEKGADVNTKANSGYTPLHLAVCAGHTDCVKSLLKCGADITITDDYGKTPKQTASLSAKSNIYRLLRSEEIMREVETNGSNLTNLLRGTRPEDFESGFLEKALMAAVKNDNHTNVGKFIVKGAKNTEQALKLSTEMKMHNATAMLLLIKIAQTSDKELLFAMFNESSTEPLMSGFTEEDSAEVRKAVVSGKVCPLVGIELARRHGNKCIREELLLKTDVNEEKKSVHWHGLYLLSLEPSWFSRVQWVQELRLARNRLSVIPEEIEPFIKQVKRLDLQYNEFTSIPEFIFQLPNLTHLNLAGNKLAEIHREWPPSLTVLDLANNEFINLPETVTAPSIRKLYISRNKLYLVPKCICSFLSLEHLDISENEHIEELPAEMGQLSNLKTLSIKGLQKLHDPPAVMLQDTSNCIRYLNSKRLLPPRRLYWMKLMVVGEQGSGKTTLVSRLPIIIDPNIDHVVGGDSIPNWCYSKGFMSRNFSFSIWQVQGLKEYYATHQCFLSERSMYLLLWNVKHGEEGVSELRPWLDSISLRAPQSCVLIVGTHLDEVEDDEHCLVDDLLKKVKELAKQYTDIVLAEPMVVGLQNQLENIGILRDSIYDNAALHKGNGLVPLMGQRIPAGYFQLMKEVQQIQHKCQTGLVADHVMNATKFKSFVRQLNLLGIQSDEEIKTAVVFLNSLGVIIHRARLTPCYPHSLSRYYFISPQWLCEMVYKMVATGSNDLLVNGILHVKDIPHLYSNQFPWEHFTPFVMLLDSLEVAFPVDDQRLLVPSQLPVESPPNADLPLLPSSDDLVQYQTQYIGSTKFPYPMGFWTKLISRILHSLPEVVGCNNDHDNDGTANENIIESIAPPITEATPIDGATPTKPEEIVPQSQSIPILPLLEVPHVHRFVIDGCHNASLVYWARGIVYNSPELCFAITEPVLVEDHSSEFTEKIAITTTPSERGGRTLSVLVSSVFNIAQDNYPGFRKHICKI